MGHPLSLFLFFFGFVYLIILYRETMDEWVWVRCVVILWDHVEIMGLLYTRPSKKSNIVLHRIFLNIMNLDKSLSRIVILENIIYYTS